RGGGEPAGAARAAAAEVVAARRRRRDVRPELAEHRFDLRRRCDALDDRAAELGERAADLFGLRAGGKAGNLGHGLRLLRSWARGIAVRTVRPDFATSAATTGARRRRRSSGSGWLPNRKSSSKPRTIATSVCAASKGCGAPSRSDVPVGRAPRT